MSIYEVTKPVAERVSSKPAETSRISALSWPGAIAGLVLLIWLIPTKRYQLPVNLPFKLEPYRLFILALLGGLVVSALTGRSRIRASGHGKALLFLAGAALASQIANTQAINAAGAQTQSLKSLSYFLSFLVAFALVSSTLQLFGEVKAIVATIVIGAVVVAIAAFYESRFHYNVFEHLNKWFPFLQNTLEDKFKSRGGRLRVRASSQHPIALAVALLMTVPLAFYLAQHAASKLRQRAWVAAGVIITSGALLTVARTAVLVFLAMALTGILLRGRQLKPLTPLLAALVVATHFASPGAIKGLYHAFTPKTGLVSQQEGRAGQQGSGRIADIKPALKRWSGDPIFGHGLGTEPTTADPFTAQPLGQAAPPGTIYDDQYLEALTSLGALGFAAVLWFVWGAVVKVLRAARRTVGEAGDLLAACAVSCIGFAVGMLTFDAFAFVQVTLLFCVVAALGLRTRVLVGE